MYASLLGTMTNPFLIDIIVAIFIRIAILSVNYLLLDWSMANRSHTFFLKKTINLFFFDLFLLENFKINFF
jgi:hypothetical protein